MNISLQKSDKDYLFAAIILLLIGFSIFFQVRTADNYALELKKKELVNTEQKGVIKTLKVSVKVLDEKAITLMKVADSLQVSENKYKRNYYELNKKFKTSIVAYNNSSPDDKWDAFTEVVNE